MGEDQGVGVDEGVGVARAGRPPRRVGVDQGVHAGLGVVGVAEVLDPGDGGAGREHAVALEVEHAGEGDAVTGPAAAVGEEVVRLRGTRARVQVGEVVAAADQASIGGTAVMGAETGVLVSRSLGRLRGHVSFHEFGLQVGRLASTIAFLP